MVIHWYPHVGHTGFVYSMYIVILRVNILNSSKSSFTFNLFHPVYANNEDSTCKTDQEMIIQALCTLFFIPNRFLFPKIAERYQWPLCEFFSLVLQPNSPHSSCGGHTTNDHPDHCVLILFILFHYEIWVKGQCPPHLIFQKKKKKFINYECVEIQLTNIASFINNCVFSRKKILSHNLTHQF